MNKINIGRRIATYREKKKMSTQELADRVGRSQATISRMENGKQGVTPELLTRIARVLCIHPFALLSDHPLRHSVLLPVRGANEEEYVSSLLANALHAGRIQSQLKGAEAADALGVRPAELRMMEIGLTMPDEHLLERLANLYCLDLNEMRVLADLDHKAPTMSRRLASFQHLLSKIHHLCQKNEHGNEARTLSEITSIVQKADADHPILKGEVAEELGLLGREAGHVAQAFRNRDFLQQVKELIRIHESEDESSSSSPHPSEQSPPPAVPLPVPVPAAQAARFRTGPDDLPS